MLEWTIAFGYTFYLLTFFYDLRMAKGVHRGQLAPEQIREAQMQGMPVSTMAAGHEGDFVPEGGYYRGSTDTYRTYNGQAPLLQGGHQQPRHPKNAYYNAPNGRAANYPA